MSAELKSDLLIVGAGVIGLSAAWECVRRGIKPLVLDAGESGQASWAGGGILAALPPWDCPEGLREPLHFSLARYRQWCIELRERSGVDPEYRGCGALVLNDEAARARAWASEENIALERLDAAACSARVPGLRADAGAWWLPQTAQVRSPRLLKALVRALERSGVTFLRHARAESLETRNGRVRGVKLHDRTLACDTVLLAAGAWSGVLRPALCVRPVKGQMLMFQTPAGALPHLVMGADGYLIPRRDGLVLAGSTLEEAGFDGRPTRAAYERLLRMAYSLWPRLRDCAEVAHWAGLRPATPDGLPRIGPDSEIAGLFHCTGHFRLGLALAPGSARAAVDGILAGH